MGEASDPQLGASYICTQPGLFSLDFIDCPTKTFRFANPFPGWKMWSPLDHWPKLPLELPFDPSGMSTLFWSA